MHLVYEAAPDEVEIDLRLLHPEATVGDVTATIDPDGPAQRGLVVDGVRHGPDRMIGEIGLTHGSRVWISDGTTATGPVPPLRGTVLVVVGGPDAGRTLALPPGAQYTVGRAGTADVTVADGTASGVHVRVAAGPDGTVTATDLGSTNGTFVDGTRVTASVPLAPGSLLQVGASQLRVTTISGDDRPIGNPAAGGGAGTVPFNRPPRPAAPEPTPPRAVPDPPAEARSVQGAGLAAMIIGPLLMGGVMVAVYGDLRFAAFMLMSPVLGIGNWWSNKRRARKSHTTSTREHRAAIVALDRDLIADAEAERHRRDAALPDPAEVLRRARQPSVTLWQRRPGHADWLRLRGGIGSVPWSPLDVDDRTPRPDLDDLRARHRTLVDCPVEVDLSDGGVVGIVGDRAAALATARSLLLQAAVHHGPADLQVAVAVAPAHAADWDWTKWLPHLRTATGGGRLVASDPTAAAALLGALAARPAPTRRAGEPPVGPTVLAVIDDVTLLGGRRSPARDLLRGDGGLVAGIVIAPTEDQLPAMCNTVITAAASVGELSVRWPHLGLRLDHVTTAAVTDATARDGARALARFEDPELGLVGGGLPDVVRLLPLLGFDDVTPDRVLDGWRHLPADPPPAGPLGVGEDGILQLDLVADGPHALIGGTTGSGKSELLRSMVAGMAARVDPDHLVFVLVDYKGGSAFDECARLPHTVGMVTDLDESLGERALRSLEAELHHRERVLRDAGAQDLPAYLAGGSPAGPLPRLVVVIDEFATLATELPDFLGALVGIAQRGRSLGVHLILATQRPQGAVNANIKANTNLRIALRVQDANDSSDIIDQPTAADLSRSTPGRAYVRRGPGEVELVQSALSTAAATAGPARPVEILPFRFTAADAPVAVDAGDDDSPSDLHRLVEAVIGAFDASGAAAPRQPWLPELPADLAFDTLAPVAVPPTGTPIGLVPLGLVDEPTRQRQSTGGWDTAEGHLAVFGMVGSGTSTTLLATARSLTDRFPPARVHLYGIDFGTGDLNALTALPHTGGVVAATNREGQFQLVRRLKAELDRRRDLTAEERAEAPTIVVFVDGLPAFLAEHEGIESTELADTFGRLLNEGASVGVVFVATAERPGAVSHRLAGTFNQKVLLRLADPTDYGSIGVRLKEAPTFAPGRGYRHDATLFQVAQPGPVDRWPGRHAPAEGGPPPLRPFPRAVVHADLAAAGGQATLGPPLRLPVGLDQDHQPVALELHDHEHVLVAGAARHGVSSTLVTLAQSLRRLRDASGQAIIVAAVHDGRSPLARTDQVDVTGTPDGFEDLYRAALTDERRWFFLIDGAPQVDDPLGLIAQMLAPGRPGLHVVAGGRAQDFHGALGHWTRRVSRSRTGILLAPDLAIDGDLLGLRLPRRVPVAGAVGRGFVVGGGDAVLAQLAAPDAPAPLSDGPDEADGEPGDPAAVPVATD